MTVDSADIRPMLLELVRAGGARGEDSVVLTTPLRELGFDSQSLVALYAEVERRSGILWDETVPMEVMSTAQGMVEHLATRLVGPAVAGTAATGTSQSERTTA